MIRVVEPWNPLLMWAGPGPPSLFYIHIRLIDEALFQSSYRPFRCGRHSESNIRVAVKPSFLKIPILLGKKPNFFVSN
jgi:hypothetical protein